MALQKRGVLYRFARQTSVFAAVSMLLLVLFISPSAYALPGVNYKPQTIGNDWSTYHEDPSAGYNVGSFEGRSDVLRIGVDASAAATARLEGLQRTIISSEAVRASLYIDDVWQATDVQTGFEVKGKDVGGNVTADLRVEFVRSSGFTGWRAGNDTSGWTNIAASYSQHAWNELEFAVNKETGQVEIYINGVLASYAGLQVANYLSDVMISNYNFGSLGEDYTSRWSKLETGRYDDVSPTISFLAPAADDAIMKGSEYVSVLASDEIGLRQVGITIYNADGEVVRENAPLLTGTDCRLDVSLAGLADGWYRIDAYAVDGASNHSQTLSRPFAIDSSVPQVAITSPLEGSINGVVTIEGTMSDVHPHHYYFGIKNADGVVVAGPGQVVGDAVSGWQWDTTTYPDGVYTVTLAAEDIVGNHSEATREVRVDNTAPIVTLDSFETNPIAGEMVIFSGDINDSEAQLTLSIDGTYYPITEIQDGRWHHTFTNGLTAGRHTVSVVATDGKGNVSSIDSSPFSRRDVLIASSAFGVGTGSAMLQAKPFIDTAQIFQMTTVPESVQSYPSQGETDILGVRPLSVTSANETESPSVALEPTENGWKLLGVLWYWWALSLLVVACVGWYAATKWRRRSNVETVTE